MIDAKNIFLGLDMDTAYQLLGRDRYPYALNITKDAINAGNQDAVITNVVGNRLVSYTLPVGTNKCVGAFGNQDRYTVLYFVFNSNGNHSVLEYNNTTRTIAKVFEDKTDSSGVEILGLTTNGKITSVNVLVRNEGDILFFLDSLKRPTVMNITKLKAGTYTPVTRDIIDMAKNPYLQIVTAVYGNDTTRHSNDLRNKLVRFQARPVYDDDYKTTYNPISKMPNPVNVLDETYTSVITNNNFINVTIPTGDKSVKGFELVVSVCDKANEWGDFGLVKYFDKVAESIGNDTTITYAFYNDATYPVVDKEESILLFDYSPLFANCMDLINGDVVGFAGITEGYDRTLTPNVTLTIGTAAIGSIGTTGTLVATIQNESTGSAFYHFRLLLAGTPATGTIVNLRAQRRSDGARVLLCTYTTLLGDTTNNIVAGLLSSLSGSNTPFAAVDSSTSTYIDFSIRRSYYEPLSPIIDDTTPPFSQSEVISPTSAGSVENNSIPMWAWYRTRTIAIQYFDKKGRTNGVLYSAKVTFPPYAENGSHIPLVPTLNVKIFHQAPIWAYSYTFLFNKSDESFLWWQTPRVTGDNDYIYWEITNFDLNASKKPTTAKVLSYSFQDGDRLRLIKQVSDQTVFPDTYDATIEGVVVDPNINGTQFKGKFVKTKSVAPFHGGDYSSGNFIIELYRPSQTKATDKNETFFEIGEQYAILNPGTSTRVHAGGVTNQSTNFATPAETNLNSGDAYFRVRTISLTESGFGKFFCMDKNFVDFYTSMVSSIDGRPSVIDINAKQSYYSTLIRFSQTFEQNTNINGLNRFYPNNYDQYNQAFGDVQRIFCRNKYLYVFQKFKIGEVQLYAQLTKDPNGNAISVVTDKLLNPIQYYLYDLGVGDAPESLAAFNYAFYGCDTNKGVVWRLSQDGIIPISILYKVNSWASFELPLRTGNSKIYGAFNQKSSDYIIALEASGGSAAQTIVFNDEGREEEKGFESFVSYQAEMMVTLGNLLISFKDGQLYTHDNPLYNTFYGVTYDSKLQVVFNDKVAIRKVFNSLSYQSNQTWSAPNNGDIITSEINEQTGLPQISQLKTIDFTPRGIYKDAALLFDVNSRSNASDGLLNGDYLTGNYLSCLLSCSGNGLIYLHAPYLNYELCNRNF